jgi:hypothetical protein
MELWQRMLRDYLQPSAEPIRRSGGSASDAIVVGTAYSWDYHWHHSRGGPGSPPDEPKSGVDPSDREHGDSDPSSGPPG